MNKFLLSVFILIFTSIAAQESIAKKWTNEVLFAIRNDFARPTVHARNLFHTSIIMHDAWAGYEMDASFYLLGKTIGNTSFNFNGLSSPSNKLAAQNEAISFAVYRLILHRYQNSPNFANTLASINALMDSLNYNRNNISTDYINGGPAEFGNYIASQVIVFGYLDGSNEINTYANQYYTPSQAPIAVEQPGNPTMIDPNRWQAISLSYAVDQAGNVLTSTPPHLTPEWGNVRPFAMESSQQTLHVRDGDTYIVYNDPGGPALLDTMLPSELDAYYKWNHTLVSVWQSHLDPMDTTTWDISPASIGNIQSYPTQYADYPNFYDYFGGGDVGTGYAINPKTNMPYMPQIVRRGDYARVVAEFWADGLNSETPPGHWFNIYNEVSSHPLYEKKWKGQGPVLSDLEYDVKAYLTLGGALHDAAISAWSIKGWYDSPRPVSAIRYMADKGQSSIDTLANYHPAGLPLIPGYIEIVALGDPLAGASNEHVGKIKLYTWKGPSYISNPNTTFAGVDWILAENWWPYQRPSFVTPPFAGYLSGHSTFSRTAAEVMTFITGDPYFPGGMSNFVAPQNEFLEFEDGPSQDIILQWATYRDASDQCSLSRIWGGIHPPMDDIKGRLIGIELGQDASLFTDSIYSIELPKIDSVVASTYFLNKSFAGQNFTVSIYYSQAMNVGFEPTIDFLGNNSPLTNSLVELSKTWVSNQVFQITYQLSPFPETIPNVLLQIQDAQNVNGKTQHSYLASKPFIIDKVLPILVNVQASQNVVNETYLANNDFYIDLFFSESCDTSLQPSILFTSPSGLASICNVNTSLSGWTTLQSYRAYYTIMDNDINYFGATVLVQNVIDLAQNSILNTSFPNIFSLYLSNPSIVNVSVSDSVLNRSDIGLNALQVQIQFSEPMNVSIFPDLQWNPLLPNNLLQVANKQWLDAFHYEISYHLNNQTQETDTMLIDFSSFIDQNGNAVADLLVPKTLLIDTRKPSIVNVNSNTSIISDNECLPNNFELEIIFNEEMDISQKPIAEFFENGTLSSQVNYKVFQSSWINDFTFLAKYEVLDNNTEVQDLDLKINFAKDKVGNFQELLEYNAFINLDTKNPNLLSLTASSYIVNSNTNQIQWIGVFDVPMFPNSAMAIKYPENPEFDNAFVFNANESFWLNDFVYQLTYDVAALPNSQKYIAVEAYLAQDLSLNTMHNYKLDSLLNIDASLTSIFNVDRHEFTIYPNPISAGEKLNIIIDDEIIADLNVLIYNALGEIVLELPNFKFTGNEIQFNLPSYLNNGMYCIQFKSQNFYYYSKFIVK